MNYLSCRYGAGDTYLVASLWSAYEREHGVTTLIVRPEHADIPIMFGARFQTDPGPQLNVMHPEHIAGGGMADALTARPDFSQADMYRSLMQLPWNEPLAKPRLKDEWLAIADAMIGAYRNPVLLMPDARSWPIPQPAVFWHQLEHALTGAGFDVLVNRRRSLANISLGPLYALASRIGWVIGANAGGFVALVSSELVGRKTLIAPGPPVGKPVQFNRHFALRSAFPFAHQFKFDGHYYDIEEHEIFEDPAEWDKTIERILAGPHATKAAPERPNRIPRLRAPISPGDLVDRLIIAELKAQRLADPEARRMASRECTMLGEIWNTMMGADCSPEVAAKIEELQREHASNWERVQSVYAETSAEPYRGVDAIERIGLYARVSREAAESNRRRVELRTEIDNMLGGVAEAKSYPDKVA